MAINVVIGQATAGGSSVRGQVVEWIVQTNINMLFTRDQPA